MGERLTGKKPLETDKSEEAKEVVEEQAKKNAIETAERSEIERLASQLGMDINMEALRQAQKEIQITLHGGAKVSLEQYEALLINKMYEYLRLGVMWKTKEMMKKQTGIDESLVKWVLKEMAEKELKFGLRPIEHVIPLTGDVYITIEGRRFYARQQGIDFSVRYEMIKDGSKDSIWEFKCTVHLIKSGVEYEGYGKASPANVFRKDYIPDMGRKRALAHALELAFPLGVSAEDADMITDFRVAEETAAEVKGNGAKELVSNLDEI